MLEYVLMGTRIASKRLKEIRQYHSIGGVESKGKIWWVRKKRRKRKNLIN